MLVLALLSACDTSPIPVLSPWPFKADSVQLSCEWADAGTQQGPRSVYVIDERGKRYAANSTARANAPYMLPLLAAPDEGQVEREGLQLCYFNGLDSVTYRRPSGALIHTG